MKIEKVNDNRIRVTLSNSDLEERNLDFSSLSYNSPQAQVLFWDMLHQAEIEFGFSATDAQLFIEATPGSGDNFIVTLTKIEEDGDFESIQKYIRNRFRKSELRIRKKNKKVSTGVIVYSFGDFEDLCSVAWKISDLYNGDSTLYKCDNMYYLVMTENSIASTNPAFFELTMGEYGSKVANTAFVDGYLSEYGTKMIEYNALEIIKDFFRP